MEVRADARDETLREARLANERAIADLNGRIDRLDACMDELSEKLSNAIVAAFEKATEQFASRETLTWWTSLLTRGLLWLVGLGLFMIATGRFPS
jgi:hypothetical protein